MKVSAIISSYLINKDPRISPPLNNDQIPHIKRCVDSLIGHDELIVFTHTGLGFCEAWNTAASLAKGDYLVLIGARNKQSYGSLQQLAIEDTLVSPYLDGVRREFNGFVFCIPRTIYEKHGLFDMEYNEGCNWEDWDLYRRMQSNGVPHVSVSEVSFEHTWGNTGTIPQTPEFVYKQAKNREIFDRKWNQTNI